MKKTTKDSKKRNKIPSELEPDDLIILDVLCKLLEPFAEMTDSVQADNVSYSGVLMELISFIECNLNNRDCTLIKFLCVVLFLKRF